MRCTRKPWTGPGWTALLLAACFLPRILPAAAADLDQCKSLFLKGNYADCITQAKAAIADSPYSDEQWPMLLARAQLATGLYAEAESTITHALERYQTSIQLHMVAHDFFTANGKPALANAQLEQVYQVLQTLSSRTGRYRPNLDPADLVALGQALLLMKTDGKQIDPKLVLANFFDQARQLDPNCREAYLATGELALEKSDFKVAADTYNAALKKFPDDPEVKFGIARAYASSDPIRMGRALEAVLDYNSNHVPAMLLLADRLVDGEQYDDAEKLLTQALEVNPWDPEAWAYRAVLAHLHNDTNAETEDRGKALKYWKTNPAVDHLIGAKLAQNYRFLEGSDYERRALTSDPDYLPAKIQLAQDLLRLGDETEGWRLAKEVHDEDGYDITAHNLTGLEDEMAKFKTITNKDFIVRMAANEAPLYGDRVLALLQSAKDHLSEKYSFQPEGPTYVEIFPTQKDFGVRTFGMPHNPGFLGVCFGHVITANSPAAQSGHPENWEAVLWHEFCHVITLGITRNKMPRWLSEGISVYEERQANPVWGQAMNPHYREMVLGEDLTPVAELSSAFLSPKSALHVQFAYYESSLVVEFLVKNYGLDALKKILVDLGNGTDINVAIARNTAPMEKIEKDFAAFARDRANNLAPGLDWTAPAVDPRTRQVVSLGPAITNAPDSDVLQRLMRRREAELHPDSTNSTESPKPAVASTNTPPAATKTPPTETAAHKTGAPNYWELVLQAGTALEAKDWEKAKTPLQKLIELYPDETGADSAYPMLAAAYRELNETNQEREVLIKSAALEADATDTFLRLMELDEAIADWPGVATNAERYLAVNPLVPQPYRQLARASEHLGNADSAIRSYQRLLLLDPPDPADVHYRLAKLQHEKGDNANARRQVLQALEEAPRFRDALHLLLEIDSTSTAENRVDPVPAPH